ncbi:hypothetical protein [Phenylobacterium sp.]|uniref:hypothetical protein n=1 Tax=Phenylobacterium sp. TaxID=1871053 RepID=UPI003919E8C0
MLISMLAAVVMLADGTPAAAEGAKKADDANKMICKSEAVAGSRMPKRICATKAEWEQRRLDAKDALDKSQTNRPLNGTTGD